MLLGILYLLALVATGAAAGYIGGILGARVYHTFGLIAAVVLTAIGVVPCRLLFEKIAVVLGTQMAPWTQDLFHFALLVAIISSWYFSFALKRK